MKMSLAERLPPVKLDIGQFIYLSFGLILMTIGLIPTLVAAGADFTEVGYLAIVHLIAVSLIAIVFGWLNAKAALLFLVLMLPWQPFLSMPLSTLLGSTGVRLLVSTKEVYVAALLGVLVIRNLGKFRWKFVDTAAILFLMAYTFSAVTSPAGRTELIVSFREGFMIIALFMIGRLAMFDWKEVHWLLRGIVIVSLFVALFGFIERFLFSPESWNKLGAIAYLEAKYGVGKPGAFIFEDLPRQWYTYIGEVRPRRMVGPIGDAPSFSRFLSFAILILLYVKGIFGARKTDSILRWIALAFLGAALLLSFGRGGAVIVLGGVLVWMFFQSPLFATILGIPALAYIFLGSSFLNWQSPSAIRHMIGFTLGFNALKDTVVGHGLGSSGQLALLYSKEELVQVSESYFGGLAYQTGILGIAAYFIFAASILFLLYRIYRKTRMSRRNPGTQASMALLAFAAAGGIFVTSMLANSAVAPISGGLPLIYAGAIITAYYGHRNSYRMANQNQANDRSG